MINFPNNLNFIIEGPDNVGKSTLITNLKNKYNKFTFHTLHYSRVKCDNPKVYNRNIYTEMFSIMERNLVNIYSGVICDRSHLGELVYSPIYRDYSGEYVLDIEKQFKKNLTLWDSTVLITLIDTPENLISRDDGLSHSIDIDIDKKTQEISLFEDAHNRSNIRYKFIINIQRFDAEAVLSAIDEYLVHIFGEK